MKSQIFTLASVLQVPPIQWLPWIPQLLTCLVRSEGRLILNLLSKVGSIYPQAVYFPIRTLYLTLKIEQRERCQYIMSCLTIYAFIMWSYFENLELF